jgi:hypothetical protein
MQKQGKILRDCSNGSGYGQQIAEQLIEAISFGFGFYASLLLCLACAAVAARDSLKKPV